MIVLSLLCFFFFNDTATTEIYTLSLHDALPICCFTACLPCAISCSVSPTTTNDEVAYVKATCERPALARPSSTAGRTTSRRYFGLLNGCTCSPSQTSPATRHIAGFTPAM